MCDKRLSRYKQKLNVSKVWILSIGQIYFAYAHYESSKGNILILIQLILAFKVCTLVLFFILDSFPIHKGDCCIFKRVERKLRLATFLKTCDLNKKIETYMNKCDFYEKLLLLEIVLTVRRSCVTFQKGCNFSKCWTITIYLQYPLSI